MENSEEAIKNNLRVLLSRESRGFLGTGLGASYSRLEKIMLQKRDMLRNEVGLGKYSSYKDKAFVDACFVENEKLDGELNNYLKANLKSEYKLYNRENFPPLSLTHLAYIKNDESDGKMIEFYSDIWNKLEKRAAIDKSQQEKKKPKK